MAGPRGTEAVFITVRFCISNKRERAANPQAASALPMVWGPAGQTTFHFCGSKALMVHGAWTSCVDPSSVLSFFLNFPIFTAHPLHCTHTFLKNRSLCH